MAYILKINERIIDTKTNPKPIQNQYKTNLRIKTKWVVKLDSYELESERSRNMNI